MNEFFIASESDLDGLLDCRPPNGKGSALKAELDLLMLCNLESILTGLDWESVFDRDYINPVSEHGPDGPWVYQVSEGLLNALNKLSPDAIASAASRWAETDEWTLRNDSTDTIADVLSGLIGLAQKAGSEGKRVFIWTEP